MSLLVHFQCVEIGFFTFVMKPIFFLQCWETLLIILMSPLSSFISVCVSLCVCLCAVLFFFFPSHVGLGLSQACQGGVLHC